MSAVFSNRKGIESEVQDDDDKKFTNSDIPTAGTGVPAVLSGVWF